MTVSETEFKQIYNDNYTRILRLCMGYVSGDIDLAKDLTQEVFIKVWYNVKTFRKESNISTWIYRIAINTCLISLRKKRSKRFSDTLLTEDILEKEEATQLKEKQYQEMYGCINKLSATNKGIILMELEGLAQKEIAAVMGLKHEAVRTRIHRIKNQLTKCVNHE